MEDPKEVLNRLWKAIGVVLIATAFLIWTQWNMWPPPTDHTPWQEVLFLPLFAVVVFGTCGICFYWDDYRKAKQGKPWWYASEHDKKWQFERLR